MNTQLLHTLNINKLLIKQFLLFALLLLSIYTTSFAQEVKGVLATANEAFIKYEYANAAKLYEKALVKKNTDTLILSRLAYCYKEMNEYEASEKYYNKLITLPGTNPQEWLYFGDMLKSNAKYAAAKEIYQQYQQQNGKEDISYKIEGCDSALYWISHPDGYSIENMAYLNTAKSDWGAVYNPYTNSVVFVSDSLRNTKKNFFQKTFNDALYGRTDNFFQKIYSISNAEHDVFNNQIHEFDPTINSFSYHTGPVVFSNNYDSVYFTVTYDGSDIKSKDKVDDKILKTTSLSTRRLQLYLSTQNKAGQWNQPVPFTYNNPAAYSVGHAALSADGRVLYFTSDMPGGVGGLDIWYCERLITGNWGLPKNCGSTINTKDDEAFPVVAPSGNLFFASKGHAGMGGYDIFVASGEKNIWTTPLNMGYPLNSSGDDFYYVAKDDTSGFFASNRKGGLGNDDIYQFITNQQPAVRSNKPLVLETTVIDNATKDPINDVSLTFLNTNTDRKWEQKTNVNGKTWHEVDNTTPYAITANKKGYYSSIIAINTKNATTDTMRVIIPLDNQSDTRPSPKVYRLTDALTTLHEGDRFRINNIHYDFDKDNIRRDAAKILDTLIDILHQYPSMVIELSSHTDSRGSDEYNFNLANRRAKSAVAYLVSHGIAKRRLVARGYGEMMLLNGCSNDVPCTEEEHQANRRTEVRILKF